MTSELEIRDLVKHYGSIRANDGISMAVDTGEIRGVVGENGAGKSTLMSIVYGEQRPDSGEIYVRGRRINFRSPVDAINAGLGMVHQSFMLFPSLTVIENVVFGAEPTRGGLIDWKAATVKLLEVASRYGLQVSPGARVDSLPVGVRQRVEILKALYRGADILILDEPTGVLTPQEVKGLFETLRTLREQGKTIIFISHKLNEVKQLCDNATVLRDGKVTVTLPVAGTTLQEMARAMTGRDVVLHLEKADVERDGVVLDIQDASILDESKRSLVSNVSFSVHGGEVVGVAGVAGNGQTELIEALTGLRRIDAGRVMLQGNDITAISVVDRRRAGMAYVPEDRAHVGAALDASVRENLVMGFQTHAPISRRGLLSSSGIADWTRRLIRQYSIKVGRSSDAAASLSGGNLQKVTLARELSHGAPCLIVEQPTRGLDIGAIEFVHGRLMEYRAQGHAILLVSAELSEIMALSDRILVMLEGKIVGEIAATEATEAGLGMLMSGAHATVIPRAVAAEAGT